MTEKQYPELPLPVRDYPPLPDFETVEQHIYAGCRRFISGDILEPIHNLIRDAIDADRAMRAQPVPAAVAGEPVMWAYQYSDGSWHDASATEHSAGMKPLYPGPQPQASGFTAPQADSVLEGAPTDAGPISRQWLTVVYRGVEAGDEVRQICTHPKVSAMSWSHAIHDRDAARSQAKGGGGV